MYVLLFIYLCMNYVCMCVNRHYVCTRVCVRIYIYIYLCTFLRTYVHRCANKFVNSGMEFALEQKHAFCMKVTNCL